MSGPARHGLVATDVVGTIEAFFSLRDRGGPWLSGGTCLAEHCFGRRVSEGSDLFTSDEKLLYTARDVLSTRVRAENAAGGVFGHGTDDPEACRGQ